MTFFTASFETVLIRYFLMMALIIVSFSVGYPLFALLSLPVFISALSGLSINYNPGEVKKIFVNKNAKEITLMDTAA